MAISQVERMGIDRTDRAILDALQHDARISNVEIARRVGLVPSAIFQRIRKLEEQGVLSGCHCTLDARALDRGLVAFVLVGTREHTQDHEIGRLLAELPEVQEVHRAFGEDGYVVKVRVRDTDALAILLDDRIRAIPAIVSTRTTIVVRTIKETLRLPLGITPASIP
jgi:Lrp/AsnC family leucine-responsive transcriptional regulator